MLNSSYSLGFVSVQAIMQYENVGTDAVLPRPNKPVLPWRDSHSGFCFIQPPVLGGSHVFHLNASEFRYPKADFWQLALDIQCISGSVFVFSKGQMM